MKNKKLNFIILFIALILVLYFTLKDDFNEIIAELKKVNIFIFFVSIVILLISLFFKAASLKVFVSGYNKKYPIKKVYLLTLIGQFVNGITPFQSGGQPFQIYLLKKDGFRITDSTNAMIKDFIAFQTALILVGFSALLLNFKYNVFSQNTYLNGFIFLGFFINVIILILLLIISSAKKTGLNFFEKLVSFLFKFKIVRKLLKNENRIKESLKRFYKTGSELKQSKIILVKGVVYNIIHLLLLYIIPYIILTSLGANSVCIIKSMIAISFVMLIGNFVPIPGATGGIEYSFLQFFGKLVSGPVLLGAMLLWRFVTYFLAMIIGFICLLFKKGENKI